MIQYIFFLLYVSSYRCLYNDRNYGQVLIVNHTIITQQSRIDSDPLLTERFSYFPTSYSWPSNLILRPGFCRAGLGPRPRPLCRDRDQTKLLGWAHNECLQKPGPKEQGPNIIFGGTGTENFRSFFWVFNQEKHKCIVDLQSHEEQKNSRRNKT